ncbi:MAG: hypoxanthine phosphoribosyltransferase [Syntrophorhabdaceae bacterium]|nr:hypoxanthine phosphoribosyltransferase [Syntrophorhabdaceae bacterium]
MLKILFTKEEIEGAVKRLASLIGADYDMEKIIFICLLKGSFVFASDLIRKIKNPVEIDFMRVASYGSGTTTTGNVVIMKDIEVDISGKHVIIIEDIIDTGLTLKKIKDILEERRPKSLKICALLDKRARRKVPVEGDYVGFTIEDGFVVGYGIDYAEEYRNLPYICVLEGERV